MKTIDRNILTNDMDFVDTMKTIYECASDYNFSSTIYANKGNRFYHNLLKLIAKYVFQADINVENVKYNPINIMKNNKDILVLFSGGKDSLACALKYKELGYNISTLFIDGINFGYNGERAVAKKLAEKYGFNHEELVLQISGRQDFMENPVKNCLLIALAVQYGYELGITNYCLGNFAEDKIDNSNIELDFSDSIEVIKATEQDIQQIFPNLSIMPNPFTNETECMTYLYRNHPECINDIMSCILPYRFQESKHNEMQTKYRVELPTNFCGACWKCCLNYIIGVEVGYLELNPLFYQHCIQFLCKKVDIEFPSEAGKQTNCKEIINLFLKNDNLIRRSKYFNMFEKSVGGIDYRFATLNDLDNIKALWNKNTSVLGRYFISSLQEEILASKLLVAYDNDILVGFGGVYPRLREGLVEIDGLCVNSAYRGNHIASTLISMMQQYGLPIVAEAVDGADNNKFYEKIGEKISERMSKSGTLKLNLYKINKL